LFIPVKIYLYVHLAFKVSSRRRPPSLYDIPPNPCNLKVVLNAFTLLNWSWNIDGELCILKSKVAYAP
jgi:hypothetical protein